MGRLFQSCVDHPALREIAACAGETLKKASLLSQKAGRIRQSGYDGPSAWEDMEKRGWRCLAIDFKEVTDV